jgi:hypothetical protein
MPGGYPREVKQSYFRRESIYLLISAVTYPLTLTKIR